MSFSAHSHELAPHGYRKFCGCWEMIWILKKLKMSFSRSVKKQQNSMKIPLNKIFQIRNPTLELSALFSDDPSHEEWLK